MARHHRLLLDSAVHLSPANGTRTSHRETMTRRLRLLDSAVSLSPAANGTRTTSVTYGGDTKFDSNVVIILAALLFALLCALGLNSIVRFALRCAGTHGTSAVAVTVRTASGGPVRWGGFRRWLTRRGLTSRPPTAPSASESSWKARVFEFFRVVGMDFMLSV